ncbi:NAD(P)/FAD-dependent oxidoreductase [Nocardiopsis ansamitocini]|uniref:Oxidoreductase n=1 Tax=Nocardiopsis ansamitocini TaxID=1670832 RepID=A0A9W6P757_9ACTN|nr:FAD-dependent oxidoreductase [Nocardiopsis ansamitocini]GLU48248.1 oxidoreductase [Nocardiopsis ansamitocini]
MTHQVVVLGAGYAGLAAATRAARGARDNDIRVMLVDQRDRFVERVRLHQLAAGQPLPEWPLERVLAGTAVEPVVARVTGMELDQRCVQVRTADGTAHAIGYDTLVYALGSTAAPTSVPGAAEHAHSLDDVATATELGLRVLPRLAAAGGVLAVVGGGLTGIEAAAELAESHRGLRVVLITGARLGPGLSVRGRAHVHRCLTRLGVRVVEHRTVLRVEAGGLVLGDGTTLAADAVLCGVGFATPGLAREAGMDVDENGRVLVDATQCSVSHPEVYAVGDAARVRGPGGATLRMSCATGLPMGITAGRAIADRAAGRPPTPLAFRYHVQCVSLGRRDGLIQSVRADDTPRSTVLTGRAAALVKEAVVRGASANARMPLGRAGKASGRRVSPTSRAGKNDDATRRL